MKRALLPLLLGASLALSACGATPTVNQLTPAPNAPTPGAPAPVGNHTPPPTPDPPKTEPVKEPEPVNEPPIIWKQRDLGFPLVSADPRAEGKKVALLTFDDGPSGETTISILETLKANNAKAMFFITGYSADKYPELLKRIHEEGHVLAVHAETHADYTELTVDGMRKEIEPLRERIKAVTGEYPKYLRPPYGAYNGALLELSKEYGLHVMTWSLGSLDWEDVVDGYKDPKIVTAQVVENAHQGADILMHDTLKHTAEALPEIIKQLKGLGYEFVTLQ